MQEQQRISETKNKITKTRLISGRVTAGLVNGLIIARIKLDLPSLNECSPISTIGHHCESSIASTRLTLTNRRN